jgi:predicted nucleic acid-binding protein
MSLAHYLADTSALVRLLRSQQARARWEPQITAGLVAICPIVELEVLHTARSKTDRDEIIELLQAAFTCVAMPERVFDRGAQTQAAMTARGAHRSAGAVDLLIAATAELSHLVLLHYDRDFDRVREVTGQPTQWLANAETLT